MRLVEGDPGSEQSTRPEALERGALADPGQDAIVLLDPDGRVQASSGALALAFGHAPEALRGQHVLDLVHSADAALVAHALGGVAQGRSQVVELRVRAADGSFGWAEVTARPLPAAGSLERIALAVRAVPGRRSATAAPGASAGDGYMELDADALVAFVSRRYLELFGLDAAEIARVTAVPAREQRDAITTLISARVADRPSYLAGVSAHFQLSDEITFEDIALVDGRTVERYGAPHRDAAGRVVGRALFLRDVTARRHGEIELRERARQQATVAELAELALNAEALEPLLTLTTRLVAATLGCELVQLLEATPDGDRLLVRTSNVPHEPPPEGGVPSGGGSLSGFTFREQATVVVADLATEQRFQAPALRALGVVSSVAVLVRGRDGVFGVLQAHARRQRRFTADEVHFLETVASLLSAMLARHDAEELLVARERQLRAIVEHATDAITTFDDQGRLAEVNPAACRLFGRTRAELVGQVATPLFGERNAPQVAAIGARLQTEGRCAGELEVAPPGVSPRQVEYTAVARILPGLHLGLMRDVTERRALQARLALADRMASVGTLAAGVAHELNNPLSYVMANLAWVAEMVSGRPAAADGPARDDLAQAMADAQAGAQRMRDIIRDLRTFSRGDETRAGEVRLEPVLESCVHMAWNEIRHRARLIRDFRAAPSVHGNEARLAQVFLNLLVNAAQAIPEGAADHNEIRVTVRPLDDDRVAVEVQDTGAGIAPEHRPRIFDPFFTTKPPGVGTGLGLSICHNLVAAMGGTIEVESAPLAGALFRVVLRRWTGPAEALPLPLPEPAPQPARGRVLVVDDEPAVGAAVRRTLAAEHDVDVVTSAREALERLDAGTRYDVVVTDLLMPDLTGIDLWRELRVRAPALAERMIFVTGGAFTPASHDFVERHRESCLEKPFELEQLRSLVRARLAARAA
ncbi:PAS domain S-box protein [Anaeromyxobacter diazotrophicus]|uniref:PAS domain S-box protein n=1 Tax=Anaeromyxobacter diazotrophicus TaxID=2590199 RepID=UPI00158FF9ED|nr:PAS domain S-box protein [Anaeromyxobacter diazotrophicus]